MKKLFSLMFVLTLTGIVFNACNKEDDDTTVVTNNAPTISDWSINGTLSSATSGDHVQGDTIKFSFLASDNEGLQSFTVTQPILGSTLTLKNETLSGASTTIEYTYVVSDTATGGSQITLTFTITDDGTKAGEGLADEIVSRDYTITVTANTTSLSTTNSGMFYHIAGSLQGAYDLVNDVLVSASSADSSKDMINIDSAGVAFTGSWTSGRGTKYVKDNGYDYDNATEEAAASSYSAGTQSATVSNPAANDIYVGMIGGTTDYVVVKITAVDPTDNTCGCGNTGIISFAYKKK